MAKGAKGPIVIWHNPRCSKSREALALLRSHGVEPEVRAYLEQPPTAGEVESLLDLLGGEPRALLREGEAAFKATGRKAAALTRGDVARLIAAHPILLQRPVVVAGSRAVIGRPPESVLELVGKK